MADAAAENDEQDHFCRLPEECMAIIFQKLCVHDKQQVAQVCTLFRNIMDDHRFWSNIWLARLTLSESDDSLTRCLERRGILHLTVCNRESLYSVVKNMPSLGTLDLTHFLNVDFEAMFVELPTPNLPDLSQLELSGCTLMNDNIVELFGLNFPTLKYLDISSCPQITDRSLDIIQKSFLELDYLNLANCSQLSDEGIHDLALGELPLEELILRNNTKLTDESLRFVVFNFRYLEDLDLEGCHLTNEGMHYLSLVGCLRLKYLSLSATHIDGDNFKDLLGLENLETLYIAGCRSIGVGLRHLATMTSLRMLFLRDCTVGRDGLFHLTDESCLIEDLRLDNCDPIRDQDLRFISMMRNLVSLLLSRCPRVTINGFREVCGLRNEEGSGIRYLSLSNFVLTNVHFEYLSAMAVLLQLSLSHCTLRPDTGLYYLQSPFCTVEQLNLSQCEGVTDVGLNLLTTFIRTDNILEISFIRR